MSNNSNGFIWDIIIVAVLTMIGFHHGKEYQRKIDSERRRDEQLEELKRQIIDLKARRNV